MAGDSKEVARAHLADAGVEELPDDWDVVTLGDLFTEDRGIAVGVMYPGDHDPDGVPLIKAGDLNGSIINPQPDFRISRDKHQEYRRTAPEGGELLMTLVGNVGQCAVVPPRMAGWNTARAQVVLVVSALDYFITELVRLGMVEFAKGSRAKTDAFLRFEMPLSATESAIADSPHTTWVGDTVREKHSWQSFQDPTNPGFRWTIDAVMTNDTVDFVEKVAEAIYKVSV